MHTDIIIRKAVESDIIILSEMLSGLFSIEDDFQINSAKQKKALEMIINNSNNSVIFIAECGTKPAGMINLQKIISTAAGGYSLLLEDLYVISEFRKNGVASMLLEKAVNWGLKRQAVRIQLAADIRNDQAGYFYSRKNFTKSNMFLFYKFISEN